ncbi:MAG: metallophosphoesterase, partial [Pirellulales bacterium]|nr:metallophosphoesterase [Pirellulales bacterium]
MYDLEPQPVMDSWATRTQLYQVISVEPERIAYRALNAIGDVHDAFRLEKTAEGGTRLVNEVERPVGL